MPSRRHVRPALALDLDHSDLALQYDQGRLHESVYADEVISRACAAYPFLGSVPEMTVLRLVNGLPDAVRCARDGRPLSDRVVAYLGLAQGELPAVDQVRDRVIFHADQFVLGLFGYDEMLALDGYYNPEHPGRRYVAWLTELPDGDLDDRTLGPWFGATPYGALAAACDGLQQFALGEDERHMKEAGK